MKRIAALSLAVATAALCTAAQATIVVSYGSQSGGLASWNATVAGAGGTATHDQLAPGSSAVRTGYTIFDGNTAIPASIGGIYSTSGYSATPTNTTGGMIGIDPAGPGQGHGQDADPRVNMASGITFTFTNPVNGIGFEVGDWSTCCQVSNLYISFGNGPAILVGSSTSPDDQFLTANGPIVFVGAFDDTGTFNNVHFWGDGFGEYLVAGGTIHFTTLQQGSLVPEPGSLALLGLGLAALGAMRRRVGR